ncbi:flagellar hook-basal body complex protein [Terrarubrum flagellatum]|uniref:flagellar hook protein FlgE n=1 Tax=Terrirubrum flagellatum TaxID=2895980 RepID=UPI003144E780
MGVFGAMITAVSGLQAQSYALENISGNIANSQTTGFKRVDTGFLDLVTDAPRNQSVAGSTLSFSRATNTVQGDVQTTGIPTNIALNGQGYFVVGERTGTNGDTPVFSNNQFYTRRGDFALDKNGYLVNGSGYYLRGATIDPQTGTTVTASTDLIKIPSSQLSARQTSEVLYSGNLPSLPQTNYQKTNGGATSELIQPSTYTTDPVATGTVIASDDDTFLNQSLAAGSMTIYNDIGAPVNVQMRWAKVSDPAYTTSNPAFGSTEATWQLFYQSNSTATGSAVQWTRLGTNFTFASSGQMTSPTTVNSNVTVDGVTVTGVDFTFPTLTQFSDANGQITNSSVTQNGYSAGELLSVAVGADGRISGTYSNGQVAPLAQIAVVQFQADDALKRREGGAFEQTLESGQPTLGLGGATLVGGSLEASNTDIADEFSKMIVTQQAYSANTRVISTAQQMLQDTINIIR